MQHEGETVMSKLYELKKTIRFFLRRLLDVKENETVKSAIERKKLHIIKKIDKRKVSMASFRRLINKAGIKEGDTIIIHCAWRGCYSLDMSPDDVIGCFKECVGADGLVLMPAYGNSREVLDIKNTKSAAGVLSEAFRIMDGVYRSKQPHFSMCAWGKDASDICSGHEKCKYSFDSFSPYYKAIHNRKAKVVLIGLDKRSVKTPIYHLAAVESIGKSEMYKNIYDTSECGRVIDENGEEIKVKYLVRNKNFLNDDKIFLKLLSEVKPVDIRVAGFSMVVIDGMKLYQRVLQYCVNQGKIYRHVISVI